MVNQNLKIDIWHYLEQSNEKMKILLNLFKIVSSIGFACSLIMYHFYFSSNGIPPQDLNIFAILVSLVLMTFYIILFFTIIMAGPSIAFFELSKMEIKNNLKHVALQTIIILSFYYIIYFVGSYFIIELTNKYWIIIIFLIAISVPTIYIWNKKVHKHMDGLNIPLVFMGLYVSVPFSALMLFFVSTTNEHASLSKIFFTIIMIVLVYASPFLYLIFTKKKSIWGFIGTTLVMTGIIIVILSPKLLIEMAVQNMHLGRLYYPTLKIAKDTCTRLNNEYVNITCINGKLKNITAIWIAGERLYFKTNDINKTKILLNRDELRQVL